MNAIVGSAEGEVLHAFAENVASEGFAAGGLYILMDVGHFARGLERVEEDDEVFELIGRESGEGRHATAESALMNEFAKLRIFNTPQAAGDGGAVFAAPTVAAMADGTIVVIHLLAGFGVGTLHRSNGGGDGQKKADNG